MDLGSFLSRSVRTSASTTSGKPTHGSDLLRTGFLPALRRAGVRRVRFHDLRHSLASNLLAAGDDAVTVSKALGHANVHITLTPTRTRFRKSGTAQAMHSRV